MLSRARTGEALLRSALLHHARRDLARACADYARARRFPAARLRARLGLGECRIAQGRLSAARTALRQALREDPGNASAWLWLGVAERGLGRLLQAEQAFSRAAEVPAQALRARLGLGDSRLALGKLEEAGDAFRGALALDPRHPKAHLGLARIFLREGNLALAESHARTALGGDPRLPGARLCLGEVCRALGRLPEALDHYRAELALRPGDGRVLFLIGEAQAASGDGTAAKNSLSQAASAGSEAARFLLAELASGAGEEKEARAWMARRPPPGVREGGLPLIRAALSTGDFSAAFRESERLLREDPSPNTLELLINPLAGPSAEPASLQRILGRLERTGRLRKNPWGLLLRTTLLAGLQDPDAALSSSKAFSPLPEYAFMRFLRGRLLLHASAYAEAEKEFSAVLKRQPGFWKARAFQAESALCRGRSAEADRGFSAILASISGREEAEARAWRGELRLWRGDYKTALQDADEGVRGGAAFAACWRGAARLQLGETDAALEDLDSALRSNPKDCEALVWRGEALRRSGKASRALADLDAALSLEPGSVWALANRALARLDLGRPAAAEEDLAALSKEARERFAAAAGRNWKKDAPPSRARPLLEAGLALARGLRRADPYLRPLWMKPIGESSRTGRSRRRGR